MNRWDGYTTNGEIAHVSSSREKILNDIDRRERASTDGSIQFNASDAYRMLSAVREEYANFVKKLTSVVNSTDFNFNTFLGNATGSMGPNSLGPIIRGTIDKGALVNAITNACWAAYEPFNKNAKSNIEKMDREAKARANAAYARGNSIRRYGR